MNNSRAKEIIQIFVKLDSPIKIFKFWTSVIVLIGSIFWIISEGTWEPIIATFIASATILELFFTEQTDEVLRRSLDGVFNLKTLSIISKITIRIDHRVLSKVRHYKKRDFSPSKLHDYYLTYREKISNRYNLRINAILSFINDHEFRPLISGDVDFELQIEKDLSKITLKNSKNALVTIHNPKLLWECSCKGKVKKRYSTCPIHKNFRNGRQAANFSRDFNNGLVRISFDSINTLWMNRKSLWPPSIDSFHLVSDLAEYGICEQQIAKIIDVGSGTGFLGTWLAAQNKNIKEVHFSDWLLLPLLTSYANLQHNQPGCQSKYFLELNTPLISNLDSTEKYDLLICNPPYLPELGFKKIGKETTVAGTQLLKSVIKYGRNISKTVVISFSDVCWPEAEFTAKTEGIDLAKCKIGKPHTVPFRVPAAYRQKGYMSTLMKERSLQLRQNDRFRYWHTINTYVLH